MHSLKDMSASAHTAIYLEKEIIEVIESIGPDKISAIVSDGATALVAAKKKINEKYKHIIPVRCIAHHINLITTDIVKTAFAKSILGKCTKIIKFFKKSHQAGNYLREEIVTGLISGGNLKTYVKTRWTTAFECTESLLRLEICFRNVSILHYNLYILFNYFVLNNV
jgi:Protein of unknown function (DUF 659)